MRLKSIKIGNLIAENNVFLAPLAGYTNAVFREMCHNMGASVTFTEMVSAKGLCYDSSKTRTLLYVTESYNGIKACQIFGSDPAYIERAATSGDLEQFDLIDINMGCPVPKIFKNGEGSALMNNMPLASEIIKSCKKSGKAVSVKFRIGLDKNSIICADFAKMCEDSGADMITVHGRTRDKMYAGEVDYAAIAQAKKAVSIPVIANGGVFSDADAVNLIERTGADGIAVARGAMYSPWIFAEITGAPVPDKRSVVLKQLEDTQKLMGERFACVFMRKMAAFYLRGKRGAAELKSRLFTAPDCMHVREIIESCEF